MSRRYSFNDSPQSPTAASAATHRPGNSISSSHGQPIPRQPTTSSYASNYSDNDYTHYNQSSSPTSYHGQQLYDPHYSQSDTPPAPPPHRQYSTVSSSSGRPNAVMSGAVDAGAGAGAGAGSAAGAGGVSGRDIETSSAMGSRPDLYAASMPPNDSRSSLNPFGTPGSYPSSMHNPFEDHRYSRSITPALQAFDPDNIADDGDDGLNWESERNGSQNAANRKPVANVGTAAAASGGVMGSIGGLFGRNTSVGTYDPVSTAYSGAAIELEQQREKKNFLANERAASKKRAWIIGCIIGVLVIGGVVGGIAGGVLSNKDNDSSSSGETAADDTAENGDLTSDSTEIKALMNNADLHKVFPGIDYTPINTQYPDCLTNPPSQNNVTRDLAVLSQLTNTIRLYGTDCNQTQMLLHSIDALDLNGTIKVWGGIWLDTNTTTNDRQMAQMYDVLDTYGASSFEGIIVGNEVLYREDMTSTELGNHISWVRSNLTSRGIDLPVATSDLGDDWTAALAAEVDYVMANIHPFFAGVTAEEAAGWTWDFWQSHDAGFVSDTSKNIISETGWPSAGGMDCGAATSCTNGSVAGIDEMNTFMENWVCQALTNGTTYFWFEAFDEPWKIVYNTDDENWEDKWGLMDVNRNLKSGVKIPDCDGQTVDTKK